MRTPVTHPWGDPFWSCPIAVTPHPLTDGLRLDVAIVGAGFTGLATAHYVQQLCPGQRVAVFDAHQVGHGASGRTGGLILEDTAVGPLPGVGDCIATLCALVQSQSIQCDLRVQGCWEIGRHNIQATSPIRWDDHGTLAVVYDIPGGAFDPRQYLAGLARLIEQAGGQIFEHAPVTDVRLDTAGSVCLTVADKTVTATRVVFGTNPWCLPLLGLHQQAEGIHTVAVATEPLDDAIFEAIGWGTRTPFYTLDLPYLWGRVTADNCAVIGAGTTGLGAVDAAHISAPDAVALHDSLAYRIRHLHPALRDVRITHRWMGPLCRTHDSKPLLTSLDDTQRVLIATGYRGHGVALSARVGKLLAEVIAGYGALPAWSARPRLNIA